jgi:hypothetical protein
VRGDQFSMRLTVHARDRYDFNKGMADIASGLGRSRVWRVEGVPVMSR